jgi:hypothetical protein
LKTGKQKNIFIFEELKKFLKMSKMVKTIRKPDIFSNVIPIYYLSKFTGLSPLSLTYPHDQQKSDTVKMKTSIFGVLCNLFVLMWITGDQCYMLLTNHMNFTGEKTNYVMDFESVIYTIRAVSSLIMSLTRIRKEMYKNLYNIFVVDNLLDTKCHILTRNEKFLWIQLISLIPIAFIIYAADILVMNSNFSLRMLCGLSIYGCSFIRSVTIMQFVNLAFLMRQKFKILNSYLVCPENNTQHRTGNNLLEILLKTPRFRNEDNWKDDALQMEAFYQALNRRQYSNIIMQDSTCISIQISWVHKEKLRFRALRIIWEVLCDISTSVNSMYGLQILLCVVSAFIKITANLSYSIISLYTNVYASANFYRDDLLPIILALSEFLQLFWIAASCSATSEEANRSLTLLQKLLLLPEIHLATAAEIQLFLHEVRERKLNFTAWDVFTINYSLLGSTVGAIATYLVILVQMQAN